MAVKAADPAAKSLDAAFADAMGAAPKPHEPPPPPEIDRDAPHGRDENGEPLAPHGLNKDGSVRKSPAGRKPKDEDRPRVDDTPAPPAVTTPPEGAGKDYTGDLTAFAESAWFGVSAVGKGGAAVPIVGKYIKPRERQLAAQAGVFRQLSPKLVAAVNLAAQHNARARRFAESVAEGDVTWMLTCAFLVMPFATMSAAVWRGDEAVARLAEGLTIETMAKTNDANFDAYLEQLAEALEIAAEAQAAAMAPEPVPVPAPPAAPPSMEGPV